MAEIAKLRRAFHKSLLETGVLSVSDKGVVSNADSSSNPSKRLSLNIFEQISSITGKVSQKLAGQTAGAGFEFLCAQFLEESFSLLGHLRPGDWVVGKDGIQGGIGVAYFEQFEHLAKLEALAKSDPGLKAVLGSDYLIKPDVLVARRPISDAEINTRQKLIGEDGLVAHTPLRVSNNSNLILHATVSCKWTMRSDRAQNARTEALNLMKNRKGRVPHIVVITGEPTPGRIASLAYGTGEIDCVYHFALPELIEAVRIDTSDDEALNAMIEGKRLRDISDLPFDLTI
ncbi:MAG: NgoMIV family type II restriction endonuclease [Roseibium sp.]